MKRKSLRYLALIAGLLALVGGFAAQAEAVSFFYSHTGGFLLGSATNHSDALGGVASGGVEFFGPVPPNNLPTVPPGSSPANTYQTIGWGCNISGDPTTCTANGNTTTLINPFGNPNRSGLKVQTINGIIVDNGIPVDISELFHQNQPITGNSLDHVNIVTNLRISTVPEFDDLNSTVTVTLTETPNTAPCPAPNPLGSTCDDFWTFTTSTFAPVTITSGGQSYLLTFDIRTDDPFVFIDRSNPAAPKVFTAEGQTTHLFVDMALTRIPEPASLVLVGAALIGFVGFHAMRRRHGKTS